MDPYFFVRRTFLKDGRTQSNPCSTPQSKELSTLQPWTSTGTTPLVFIPANPLAAELTRGLTKEVEILPKIRTGFKCPLKAKDFSKPSRIAKEML
jgi:hypothetical protein